MGSCLSLKCSDICRCIELVSPNGTLVIDKNICTWSIDINPNFITDITATWDDNTRQLCILDRGIIKNCVTIPDSDDQYLGLTGTDLSIYKPDGTLINTVDLSGLIPANVPFTLSSNSLVVTPGGTLGHSPRVELVPSTDINNALILGSDGKPYVPRFGIVDEIGFTLQDTPVTINVSTNDLTNCSGIKSYNITNVINGTVTPSSVSTGIFQFTPVSGFSGTGIFTYTVTCGGSSIGGGEAFIKVKALPTNTFVDKTISTNKDFENLSYKYNLDKITTIDSSCLNATESIYIVIHDGTYTFSGSTPIGLSPFLTYSVTNVNTTHVIDLEADILTKQAFFVNASGLNGVKVEGTDFSFTTAKVCNQITLIGKVVDNCSNTYYTTINLLKENSLEQVLEFETNNISTNNASSIVSVSGIANLVPATFLANPYSYFLDTITGKYYMNADGNLLEYNTLVFDLNIGSPYTIPTSLSVVANNPDSRVFVDFGDKSTFKGYANIPFRVYKQNASPTPPYWSLSTSMDALMHQYQDGKYIAKTYGYCGAYIKQLFQSKSPVPSGFKALKGGDKIEQIVFNSAIYQYPSKYDLKNLSSLNLLQMTNASAFLSSTGLLFDNTQDLLSLQLLYFHGIRIFSTGFANGEFKVPYNGTLPMIIYYFYSNGIDYFDLTHKNGLISFHMDVASLKHIDMIGSDILSFSATNSYGGAWYGTTTLSHLDKITLPVSGLTWGNGYYDFTNTNDFELFSCYKLNTDTNVIECPLINVEPATFSVNYHAFSDSIKDEIFISLDASGISNGYGIVVEGLCGTVGNSYYNTGAGTGAASSAAKTAINNLITKGWILMF